MTIEQPPELLEGANGRLPARRPLFNLAQRSVLLLGGVAVVALLLFPPWQLTINLSLWNRGILLSSPTTTSVGHHFVAVDQPVSIPAHGSAEIAYAKLLT